MVRCWPAVLAWLNGLHADPASHEEVFPIASDETAAAADGGGDDSAAAVQVNLGW